ncbi:enoyl-CoA hydratase/isomerase family protein [Streptomyces sp. MP131-18]|uniref:enoyl-CoA hydratase/isomerase family protein n=1 Tax=Streptomyces sp. MP131-18 TaxID=1857892 RepID=UPI00097C0A36|nr:enoyl-CoA hydratase/isomerase family protein [Streptomyces sp. MP131-18]ONK09626.1 putative enoyl-CoA hydratase echA8 [Streptomyces sp. MP131-18]
MESTVEEIRLTLHDRVALITLSRPEKLNAVTAAMSAELTRLADLCNTADEVRAVVLTGAGERAFCAGSDIGELDAYATPWDFRNRSDYCDSLRRLRKPVIAAVNGLALGGGLETALACDIRIASATARFGAPEIKLGWIGGGGVSAQLRASIGASNAALMLLTGDPIDAATAERRLLVSEVTEPSELLGRALEIASTIAARAPIAAETAKANLHAAASVPLDQALERERDLQAVCFATEDAAEGRAAFLAKRPPHFHRR